VSSEKSIRPALLDSRRLTGANLYWNSPSAIIDVQFEAADVGLVDLWQQSAHALLVACDLSEQQTCHRKYQGGASLLVSSPIDALYAMCELNELAWTRALHFYMQTDVPDLSAGVEHLRGLFSAERRPRLLQMQQAARKHVAPFLWDDDEVSIGFGSSCQLWPYEEVPESSGIDWSSVQAIPLALVTGTNGKSTTVRMVAAMLRAAGLRGGLTSTDFIRVGDHTIDEGDYSGTGGARMLLRHPQVEAAVLEVARGGLLRRGLAVDRADAALITNVAADHLGEYGINTVAELIEAKFIVHRALAQQSPLILNADDSGLVEYEKNLRRSTPGTSWWFSLHPDNPRLQQHVEQGGVAGWLESEALWMSAGLGSGASAAKRLMAVSEVTSSRAGLLRHNVQNALGAALLGQAMGLVDEAIREGLQQFRGDEHDNPGRGNWFERAGIHIVVDFAHNEHGMRALADTVLALGPKRVMLMMGQAGDRSDDAIRELARAALGMRPDVLLINELPGYERGRDISEPPAVIRAEALAHGMLPEQLLMMSSPLQAAQQALALAQGGDVLVLLAHIQRPEILRLVNAFVSRP
jgi:UDP-N-acetylmuramyl tripeptide synthase